MSEQGYIPGNPWIICDRCGFRVRMNDSMKTWDGLRVCVADYEIKHPQLSMKGKVDRQAVYDGRPESPDQFVFSYGIGSFCLISPNGTRYIVYTDDDGALLVRPGVLGTPIVSFTLGNYVFSVANDGALIPTPASAPGFPVWKMASPSGFMYEWFADTDGAWIPTLLLTW